ncbi:recombinase family protein [Chloroflexota bacterium]
MKAAVYCRVSTDDQGREGTSLQTQLEACQGYCKQKGYQIKRHFNETYSGLVIERPKLDELRKMVRANDIDVIVIYCLDRISRDPTHGVILTQELEKYNIKLEAVTETVESTDLGKLISYIRGFASKLEAEKIRERTMRGKQARLKEGKLPQGTGIGLYGYKWDKESGRRIIIEEEAKIVTRIFTMILQGKSFNRVAIDLNSDSIKTKNDSKWHPLTVRKIATSEVYTGKTYFGKTKRIGKTRVIPQPKKDWILLPKVTPPIITQEMFDKTQQAILQAKKSRPTRKSSPYLLTGFMRCSKCGSTIGGTTLHSKYRYYQCRGARPTATRGKICNAGYIKADELDLAVLKKINELISSPLFIISSLTDLGLLNPNNKSIDVISVIDKDIEKLRKKIKTYSSKEKNLYDLLSHQNVTKEYVLEAIDKLSKEKSDDELKLKNLISERSRIGTKQRVNIKLSDICNYQFDSIESDSELLKNVEEYRKTLERIRAEIIADPSDFTIKFYIGSSLITTTEDDAITESYFRKALAEFEQIHPDYYFDDIIEAEQLPDDTMFGRAINQVAKKFSPIVRTSA